MTVVVPIHTGTVNGRPVRFLRGPIGFEVVWSGAKPEAAE